MLRGSIGCAKDRTEVGWYLEGLSLLQWCSPCVEVPARPDKVRNLDR